MHKILFLVPDLEYRGLTKQLFLLAQGLSRERFDVRVAGLGPDGPMGKRLRAEGIRVDVLGWTRFLDLGPFRRLVGLLGEFRPDLVHSWGLSGLRTAVFATRHLGIRIVASDALEFRASGAVRDWLGHRLLGRVDQVVAASRTEAEDYGRFGVPGERLALVPPGVEPYAEERSRRSLAELLQVAGKARFILCVGPLEAHKGYQDAVWAFDILKFLYQDLNLVLVGTGPERERLEQFVRAIRAPGGIYFAGSQEQAIQLLAQADVVWVPSLTAGGANVALEAMAAGRPVVGTRLPSLVDLIRDGETGFLVPPGDKAALARQTRLLLDDPGHAARLGAAGRKHVQDRHAAAALVEHFEQLYEKVAQQGAGRGK